MSSSPLVSVIIVSYNTSDLTCRSIAAVYASKGFKKAEIEVIVVDNNSQDDSVKSIRAKYKDVKVIANKVNKGFGGGNNQGARIARGKYLLLLNTDAFLSPDSLRVMVDKMEDNKDLLSVGPQLRYQDDSLQSSGGYLPTPRRVIAWMWWLDKLPLVKSFFPDPYHVFDLSWHTKEQYPEWLMGACVLFRRSQFMAVHGFDEKIFMYAEEVELYRRLQTKYPGPGRVLFTPETSVVHIGRASSSKANAFVLVHELKGIEYIYRLYYPHLLGAIKLVMHLGVLLRLVIFALIPSRHSSLKEYWQYFSGTRGAK